MADCGAKTRAGGVCAQSAMPNGRCKFHGGMNPPPGPGHHSFKHGMNSKAIPARLRERIAAADNDPTILSHRRDLALLDARLEELLERLTEGGSGQRWRDLMTAWIEVRDARAGADAERMKAALASLGTIINAGVDEERTWGEVRATIRDRRDQATHEHKRTMELSQAIRPDELGTIIARIMFVIRREVADDETRHRIAVELEKLSNLPEAVN